MNPDFILVGGGTAGCVLASRLSEGDRHKVLLIEAGGKPTSPFVGIPAGFAKLFKSKFDWALESEPQGPTKRVVFTPRGKMLGGSSNINAQIHQWCQPADFDEWSESGATGWSWDDVAPVFVAQESWTGEPGNRKRGQAGPMTVAPNKHVNPLSHAFVAAARAAGINGPLDYNGGAYDGAWIAQIAHRNGRRFSVYDAYLKPAMTRASLRVETGATVSRLVFESGRCVGVATYGPKGEQTHRASRGVVLCAGAYGSPQIMMLSGMGPAAELKRHGIAVVKDVPEIGANLHDHPLVVLNFGTTRRDTLKSAESVGNLLRYVFFKAGPLASNAIEAMAFAKSSPSDRAADMELVFAPLEWRNQGLEPPKVHAFAVGPALLKPKSRGSVKLRSVDPAAAPVIDFAMFSDPQGHDARLIVQALRLAQRVAATPPLANESTGPIDPLPAGGSDAELFDFAARNVQTVYHPTSTCRMGSDPGAVVTPKLKVNGVEGLWIADASVMPSVPRGHPNAVVAMIGHRAADFLVA